LIDHLVLFRASKVEVDEPIVGVVELGEVNQRPGGRPGRVVVQINGYHRPIGKQSQLILKSDNV